MFLRGLCLQALELMIMAGNTHTFLDDMRGLGAILSLGDNRMLLKMSVCRCEQDAVQ